MTCYSLRNPPPPVDHFNNEESLTQQHFAKECDVNNILKRFTQTGELEQKPGSFYADFPDGFSFESALNQVASTMDQFNQLPAAARDRFHNDPGRFLDFVSDPSNKDQFVSLGLSDVKNASRDSAPLDVTVTTDTNPTNEVTK